MLGIYHSAAYAIPTLAASPQTLFDSGTQSASIGTEHTLTSATDTLGAFQLFVDTGAMVAGDVVRLRIKYKVLAGGTERTAQDVVYSNAQHDKVKVSHALLTDVYWAASLQQVAGTGRDFPWKVMRMAGT